MSRAQRPDAQAFDEVRITTIPRFKTSGLSGDEWRISARIEFMRKGVVVFEESARNIEAACNFLGWLHAKACDEHAFYAGEGDFCDQEGCSAVATTTLRKLFKYCRHGHKSTPPRPEVRRFCDTHRHRGDCGLDDADANYEED